MSDAFRPHGLYPARLLCPWNSPGRNTGVFNEILPFPSPEDVPDPGIKPRSPALQADSLPAEVKREAQPPDIFLIRWRVYNSTANTSKGVLFLPTSDAYVKSFLYLLYTLIKLYYTHKKK